MKITKEHYEGLKTWIKPFAGQIEQRRQAIISEGKAQDVEKRLRWDLLWASKQTDFVCKVLYLYLNDDHIDTALKQIVKELSDETAVKN